MTSIQYNPAARCVKCGCRKVYAKYEAKVLVPGDRLEVIKRTCANCGFEWNELPLDSEVRIT
jgi:DNA-directed RNA polymerase subunit M/transcription elongation factor TFIIS